MKNIFLKNIMLGVAAVFLVISVLPVSAVFAQGTVQPQGGPTPEKLEQVWARQLQHYEKLGNIFSNTSDRLQKLQDRIDKVRANGRDVTAIQAALAAFEAALKNAQPIYQSMNGIVTSHQGFDGSGKVMDQAKALETVKQFHEKMMELQAAMNGTGKALRDAAQTFRMANKPPTPATH